MNALSTPKQELLDRVGELFAQTQGVDFVIPDDTGYFSIEDDLVKQVRSVIRQTSDLLREIMDCYDAEAGEGPAGEISAHDDESFLKEIGAQISSQLAVEEVSGLAFVSRGQLLDMLTALDQAIQARQIWKVASYADTGLRRSGRALIAIESAMRECEGLPVEYRQWQNLDDSLEVRRVYGGFRRAVLRGGEGTEEVELEAEALRERMEAAAEAIAALRDLEIYPYLRIDDRLQIRRLQKRILGWLEEASRATDGGQSAEAGVQLWSDLVSFARLLAQINHRQELREHDRLTVGGLLRKFFGKSATPEKLVPSILALLEPLLGREDELDAIILNPDEHTGEDLRAPLERLRKELGQPFEASTHGDWLPPVKGG